MNNLEKEIAGNLLNDSQHDRAVCNIIKIMMNPLEAFHEQAGAECPRIYALDDIFDACLLNANGIALDPKAPRGERVAVKNLFENLSKVCGEMAKEVNI